MYVTNGCNTKSFRLGFHSEWGVSAEESYKKQKDQLHLDLHNLLSLVKRVCVSYDANPETR